MNPNSRDGIESSDPWGMITDEMEEAINKKKKAKKNEEIRLRAMRRLKDEGNLRAKEEEE